MMEQARSEHCIKLPTGSHDQQNVLSLEVAIPIADRYEAGTDSMTGVNLNTCISSFGRRCLDLQIYLQSRLRQDTFV